MKKESQKEFYARPIRTDYYDDKSGNRICHTNWSVHPRKAAMNAYDHLDNNHYDAWLAVVYNAETGELLRILVRHVNGRVEIMHEGDPKQPKCLTNIMEK